MKKEWEEANDALENFNQSYDKDELDTLNEVVEECEGCSDFGDGEVLIHENYFQDYIEDLVNDCWDLPKEMNEGKWPWNHLEMDWAGAAEEAKQDYHEFTVSGETYYIRA